MNEAIGKIKALLIEASNRQHELSHKVDIVGKIVSSLKDDVKKWAKEKADTESLMNTPRDEAKSLALEYVLDGQDITQLPRAMKVRYRKDYHYDHIFLVKWLIANGHTDVLTVNRPKLNKLFGAMESLDGTPATEVELAEIACDTNLKWMTEDD